MATLAALLAIGVLVAFMQSYKNSVDEGAQPVTVLVARDSLPKGVSGDMLAKQGMFQATGFKRDQVEDGAITDPASLRGQVQAGDHVDVFAGFQVQPAEGSAGRARPIMRVLLQDVEVLEAPEEPKGGFGQNQTQNIVLRVDDEDAPELAFSIDNGKVWLTLRPSAGAKQERPSLITLDRLLLGMEPIPVDDFLAGKRSALRKLYQGDF